MRAGPSSLGIAPSGAGREGCGTERVISPAPILGVLRGVPAEVGKEKTHCGFDQGGDFLPPKNTICAPEIPCLVDARWTPLAEAHRGR